jgi:hypothetical protein
MTTVGCNCNVHIRVLHVYDELLFDKYFSRVHLISILLNNLTVHMS